MQCSYADCEYGRPQISQEDAITCTQCNITIYCSPDCRALDWVSHRKNVCGQINSQATLQSNTSEFSFISQSSSMMQKKRKTLEDYEIIDQNNDTKPDLGRGTFSNVKLVREKGNLRKLYAMKILNKKQLKNTIKKEIKIQKKLNHPHIIKLHEYFEDKENVYLILEHAQEGNLAAYLKKKKKIPENEAFIFFFQTCVAVDYLHKKGVIHRDLKPDNILLTNQGNVKISDFGMSSDEVGQRNSFCGTVDYMAPEIVQKSSHDYRVDIWALGVLLYEMLHGYPPFVTSTKEETYEKILKKDLAYGNISDGAKELIDGLLQLDPNNRVNFSSLFGYSWIQKYEKEFNYDHTKALYKYGKNQSLEGNCNSSSYDTRLLDDSSTIQNLPKIEIHLVSEVIRNDPQTFLSNNFNSNAQRHTFDTSNNLYNPNHRTKSTPNIYEYQAQSPLTDDYKKPPNSSDKIKREEGDNANQTRKTSPGYIGEINRIQDTKTSFKSKEGDNNERNSTNSTNRPVDIDKLIQQYNIADTEEMEILNKLDQFYSTGLNKSPFENKETNDRQEPRNKPLESKDPNRIGISAATALSNQLEEDKSRYSRNTKERNLEMSFQDRLGASVEEENIELRAEETFGDVKFDRESEPSLRKVDNLREESKIKKEKAENIQQKILSNNRFSNQAPKQELKPEIYQTANQMINNSQKSVEHARSASYTPANTKNFVSNANLHSSAGKMSLVQEQRISKSLVKHNEEILSNQDDEDDPEAREDYERKSKALLRNFKHKLNNIYQLNSSPASKYEEIDSQKNKVEPPQKAFKETIRYAGEKTDQNKRVMEEKLTAMEMSPQKKLEKEKLIENPEYAKEWLNRKAADKDLDYSFMPKSLIYNYKTMDQSIAELRKKTEQLEMVVGEKDIAPERVSRQSWKNIQDHPIQDPSMQSENNGGLFSRLLAMIGCVERDNKGRTVNSMQRSKDKK